jgi:hypothetical protein
MKAAAILMFGTDAAALDIGVDPYGDEYGKKATIEIFS